MVCLEVTCILNLPLGHYDTLYLDHYGSNLNVSMQVLFWELKAVSSRDTKGHFFPIKNYKRVPLSWATPISQHRIISQNIYTTSDKTNFWKKINHWGQRTKAGDKITPAMSQCQLPNAMLISCISESTIMLEPQPFFGNLDFIHCRMIYWRVYYFCSSGLYYGTSNDGKGGFWCTKKNRFSKTQKCAKEIIYSNQVL